METISSRDGTRIAFQRSGTGPPLLLVHGATADHTTTWRFVTAPLAEWFTVVAMDRRGRGGSGDGPAYALAREAKDVAAVVDAIGGPVDVVGHSYGGLCALEAALLTRNLRRLIVYESVPLDGANLYPPGIADELDRLLAAGDVEGALVTMYRKIVEMPDAEIELLRAQKDAWATRVRNAPSMPRELRVEQGYRFTPARFAALRTPVFLFVGADSPARELANARGVAAALTAAQIVVLPGQQHVAMYTAPELFAGEVVRLLTADL